MHILLCLGNPRKKCNTLYSYEPKLDFPIPVSSPSHLLCLHTLPFSREQPSPLMLLFSGYPHHAWPNLRTHHSLPQNPSPPSFFKPLANSHTHLAHSSAHPLICNTDPMCKSQKLHPETAAAALDTHCKHQGRAVQNGWRMLLGVQWR